MKTITLDYEILTRGNLPNAQFEALLDGSYNATANEGLLAFLQLSFESATNIPPGASWIRRIELVDDLDQSDEALIASTSSLFRGEIEAATGAVVKALAPVIVTVPPVP